MIRKWPTYKITDLKLQWTFYEVFRLGDKWALGFIRLEKSK
jgi:hypothetical protein